MIKIFLLFLGLISFGKMIPDGWMSYFYLPSAQLTSLYMGFPLIADPIHHSFKIEHPFYPIEIIRACSGFQFFSMLFALLFFLNDSWNCKVVLRLLLFTWGITIVANTFRMISAQSVRAWTTPLIGEHWQGALHESVGAFIFIISGILAYLWKSNDLPIIFQYLKTSTRKFL